MNLLDYIIIIIMIYLLVRGVFRGFIREIASLLGIILGFITALMYFPDMSDYLKSYIPSTKAVPFISIVIIFFSVLIVCNLLGWGLWFLLKKLFLGWLDRGLGAGFAFLKGILAHEAGEHIGTDANMMTSVPGVYAIGDARGASRYQIATAVGEGATALMAAEEWIAERRAGA